MFRFILLIIIILNLPITGSSQPWPKIYGNNISGNIFSMIEDYDKAVICAGQINSGALFSRWGWLIKSDMNGEVLWEKTLGGTYLTTLSKITNTTDSGKIIAASTTKYSDNQSKFDAAFIKLNVCGEIEWCKVLMSPGNNYGVDVIELDNGDYIGLLKYYGGDITTVRISLVKMDETGEPLWIENLAQDDPGIYNEEGRYLLHTSDNNYLVAGDCSYGGFKAFWIKTDTTGQQIWDLKWSGFTLSASSQTVEAPGGGRFYATGAAAGNGHPISPSLFKFDIHGNTIYQQYLLGDTIDGGESWSLCQYNDTTLLHGIDWSEPGSGVGEGICEILMTDTLGNLLNRKFLLESTVSPDCIIKTFDDKIMVVSNYYDGNWDVYLWKLNANLENDSLYTQPFTYDSLCPYPIISDTIDLNCSLHVNINEIPVKTAYERLMKIYPNPAFDVLHFDFRHLNENCCLSIIDVFGREVLKLSISKDQEHEHINISGFPRGIYFALLKNKKNKMASENFVVQ